MQTWDVRVADCLIAMSMLAADSVDAGVTDPPYGLRFMGKAWDHGVPGVPYWDAVLRMLKPGAYLLAFGGSRTYHRLTCAIEDAGFEVRDCLSWLYGSGFPKHDSKLKPAWEPIVMARKPASRATLLNIDDCRIGDEERTYTPRCMTSLVEQHAVSDRPYVNGLPTRGVPSRTATGRWPANVVLDEEAAAALDAQTGELTSNSGNLEPLIGRQVNTYGSFAMRSGKGISDSGGASRFFYTSKASREEREAGLDGAARPTGGAHRHGQSSIGSKDGRDRPVANHHPTVKPLDLMRWLVRLVTPPNGLVLDAFCGSGSTGCAAVLEGRRFIGIDCNAEYSDIARARIAHWERQHEPSLFDDAPTIGEVA